MRSMAKVLQSKLADLIRFCVVIFQVADTDGQIKPFVSLYWGGACDQKPLSEAFFRQAHCISGAYEYLPSLRILSRIGTKKRMIEAFSDVAGLTNLRLRPLEDLANQKRVKLGSEPVLFSRLDLVHPSNADSDDLSGVLLLSLWADTWKKHANASGAEVGVYCAVQQFLQPAMFGEVVRFVESTATVADGSRIEPGAANSIVQEARLEVEKLSLDFLALSNKEDKRELGTIEWRGGS